MKYTAEFDETSGICTVRVTGRHKRPDDSFVLQQFARDFGNDQGCQRFLFDMTRANIAARTIDTFLTGTVPFDSDHVQRQQKIALVYSSHMADHRFMENVAVNRGYDLRVFDQIDRAVEWLTPTEDNAEPVDRPA